MPMTLVAGATGYLGRHLVAELHGRGHQVRAIVRSRERALAPGPYGSPSLDGLVADWAVGDVVDPTFVAGVAEGVDAVVSALGVTRQGADPWQVDHRANLAILRSAERHGAERFCYVNVIGGDRCPARLTRAKAAFVAALRSSSVADQVVNPSAYFSDLLQVLEMARRGRVLLVRPQVRLHPIHGADLAACCVDRLAAGGSGTWDVGGPEVLTWQDVAERAFAALGRPVRTTRLAPGFLSAAVAVLGVVSPRRADTLRFVSWTMCHDSVGEGTGSRRLADFFATHAGRG